MTERADQYSRNWVSFDVVGEIARRDAIIDRLIGFLGAGPFECSNGWHWIYASLHVLEPLTPDEIAYFEDSHD